MEDRKVLHSDFRIAFSIKYEDELPRYEEWLKKQITRFKRKLDLSKELRRKHKVKVRKVRKDIDIFKGFKW